MSNLQRFRLALFSIVAVVSVVFAGVEYVGIPQRYLGQSYQVSVNLPESGGIFTNAEVTLRGVAVGRVSGLHLTPDGVRVTLRIDKGVRIPVKSLVKVSNLSAVGEQYINLLPQTDQGPYLTSGAAMPVSAASTPPQVTALLVHLDQLATSIGKADLHTVVTELGKSFNNSGQDLQTVLTQAQRLVTSLSTAQPRTNKLLSDGHSVLKTQRDLSAQLHSFSQGLNTLTRTIARADPDLRHILDGGPASLKQVAGLLRRNQANVGVLLGNLLTVTQLVAAPVRLQGLNTELVLLPRIVQGTFRIQPGDGYARLGAVLDSSQAVCTQGYESSGSPPPQAADVSAVPGDPTFRANLNAYCANLPSTGIDVRGAANVPRPPGDTTATVIPQPNPRGFGPGSSFVNVPGSNSGEPKQRSATTSTDARLDQTPGSIRVVPPSSLRSLLLHGL